MRIGMDCRGNRSIVAGQSGLRDDTLMGLSDSDSNTMVKLGSVVVVIGRMSNLDDVAGAIGLDRFLFGLLLVSQTDLERLRVDCDGYNSDQITYGGNLRQMVGSLIGVLHAGRVGWLVGSNARLFGRVARLV